MRAVSLCAAMILAAPLAGLMVENAEACGWLRHCHRCQSSSSYSSSSTRSNSQAQQGVISDVVTVIDIVDRILKLRPETNGGDTTSSSSLEKKIDGLSDQVAGLAESMKQVQANTAEIERLKTAHEAGNNHVSDHYVRKEDLNKLVDDRLKSAEFKEVLRTEITAAFKDDSVRDVLKEAMKSAITEKDNESAVAAAKKTKAVEMPDVKVE